MTHEDDQDVPEAVLGRLRRKLRGPDAEEVAVSQHAAETGPSRRTHVVIRPAGRRQVTGPGKRLAHCVAYLVLVLPWSGAGARTRQWIVPDGVEGRCALPRLTVGL